MSYQWQYSDDGESWTNCKELSAGTDNYTFTMEEKLAGKYRCIVKDNTGTEIISDISEITFQKVSEKEGYVASNGITAIYASMIRRNQDSHIRCLKLEHLRQKL